MNQTTQLVTADYLQKLAEDKKNLVYHYQYDESKHKLSGPVRQQCMKLIRERYLRWKQQNQAEYDRIDQVAQKVLETMIEQKRGGSITPEEEKKYKKDIFEAKQQLHELDFRGRKQIIESSELFKKFNDDHEKTLYTLTSHTTSEEHVNHLRYMIYLQIEKEKGNISENDAHGLIQDYLVKKFKTEQNLEDYKKQMAERDKEEDEEKKTSKRK